MFGEKGNQMVLAIQHVSADSIPPGYGWSAFSPLEQIDRAAEIGGSSLIHATTTGFVWGASTPAQPAGRDARPSATVASGPLRYSGSISSHRP